MNPWVHLSLSNFLANIFETTSRKISPTSTFGFNFQFYFLWYILIITENKVIVKNFLDNFLILISRMGSVRILIWGAYYLNCNPLFKWQLGSLSKSVFYVIFEILAKSLDSLGVDLLYWTFQTLSHFWLVLKISNEISVREQKWGTRGNKFVALGSIAPKL